MTQFYIGVELEFFEVLNEFPCLKSTLKSLHISSNELKEGESIQRFFKRKHITSDEERIVLRKLNRDVNYFLKKGELPQKKEIQTFVSLEEE